jgi:hypothetical protein
MSLPARLVFFRPGREAFSGLHIFDVRITRVHRFFDGRCFMESLLSLRNPERKGYFSKCFAFYSRSLNRPLEGFFSLAPRMIADTLRESFGFIRPRLAIRVVDFDPSNYSLWARSAVLLFELWIPIP